MKKQKRKRKIDKVVNKYADKNATLANRLRVLITGAQAIGQMAVETLKKAKTSKKKVTWDTKVVDKTNFNEVFVAGLLKCKWLKEDDYDYLEFPAVLEGSALDDSQGEGQLEDEQVPAVSEGAVSDVLHTFSDDGCAKVFAAQEKSVVDPEYFVSCQAEGCLENAVCDG